MTGKNTVLLTFAGDATQLDKTMKGVGGGATTMGKKAKDGAGGLDRLGEAGGNTETRFLGLGAGISGVSTLMSGELNAETAAMAMADLGDAVEHTVVPLIQQGKALLANGANALVSAGQHVAAAATTVGAWVMMGVQAMINAAKMAAAWLISLGPIALVILAVGAVIGILMALGVGFDDVKAVAGAAWGWIKDRAADFWGFVQSLPGRIAGVASGMFGSVKNAASGVKDWIGNRVEDIVGFFTGMPGRITDAFGALGSGVADAFKSAWNNTLGGLVIFPGFNPPGPGSIPRVTIPRLHQGGLFPGAPGTEGLALLQAGERVIPAGRAQAPNITIIVQGSLIGTEDVKQVVRDQLVRGGWAA